MPWHACYVVRGRALGIGQSRATYIAALWCCLWGRGPRGNRASCSVLGWLSVTSSTTQKQIGLFWCQFPGGWVCVCSRTLWVSPLKSPVRLGVSPAAATPTGFFHSEDLRFYFPMLETWVMHSVSVPSCSSWFIQHANVGPPSLTAPASPSSPPSSSSPLATRPVHPGFPSLPVWMNVLSLTLWLLDFHTVRFSGSCGYFLFLNLLSLFWLCEQAKCIYLHLHLSQKFKLQFSKGLYFFH